MLALALPGGASAGWSWNDGATATIDGWTWTGDSAASEPSATSDDPSPDGWSWGGDGTDATPAPAGG